MKSPENGSMLSFNNIESNTLRSRSDPLPRSSHVVSFSLVYSQARRTHSRRGEMCFDRKSNITIIDIKPFSARNRILITTCL
jgi:hypothetical protein